MNMTKVTIGIAAPVSPGVARKIFGSRIGLFA